MSRTPEHERTEALKDAPIIQARELRAEITTLREELAAVDTWLRAANYGGLSRGAAMPQLARDITSAQRARDLCNAIVTLEAGEIGNYSQGKYETAARILRALDGEQP